MPLTHHTRRRLGLALAMAGAVGVLGPAAASADPATPATAAPMPQIPRGQQIVNDVLGPTDPAFWNLAVPGTRVLTPIDPRHEVICLTAFLPVNSCWTNKKYELATPRPLAHVDVPMIGGPPLRIWADLPRWGDGSTGEGSTRELADGVVIWWLTNFG